MVVKFTWGVYQGNGSRYTTGAEAVLEDWCLRCDECFDCKGRTTRRHVGMQQYNVGVPVENRSLLVKVD